MAIQFFSEGVKVPPIRRTEVRDWIKQVANRHGKRVGEVSYIFCNDEKILEVNRQYLGHDYFTDIITFDDTDGDRLAGDIFISLDTVRSNAAELSQPYDRELHRVIIHGILHLCGIDDKGAGEREVMERHEDEALAMLETIRTAANQIIAYTVRS